VLGWESELGDGWELGSESAGVLGWELELAGALGWESELGDGWELGWESGWEWESAGALAWAWVSQGGWDWGWEPGRSTGDKPTQRRANPTTGRSPRPKVPATDAQQQGPIEQQGATGQPNEENN